MPVPYSKDLREKAVAAYHAVVGTQAEVARIFGVGVASVKRWVWQERRGESLAAKVPRARPELRSFDAEGLELLGRLVREQPDISEREMVVLLQEEYGVEVSRSTVNRALRAMGLTRKNDPRSA